MNYGEMCDLKDNPQKYIDNNFIGMLHFQSFCETGDLIDLTELLAVLEEHEMYECCCVVRDVINEKVNDAAE